MYKLEYTFLEKLIFSGKAIFTWIWTSEDAKLMSSQIITNITLLLAFSTRLSPTNIQNSHSDKLSLITNLVFEAFEALSSSHLLRKLCFQICAVSATLQAFNTLPWYSGCNILQIQMPELPQKQKF